MSEVPILVRFTGEAFVPANAPMLARARANYESDEVYKVEFKEERSEGAHRAYFASINTAWKNLPEDIQNKYPTPTHMRKKALIIAGYADEVDIPCESKEVAVTIAQTMRKLLDYAVILPRDNVVKIYTARSQKMLRSGRGMDKKTFSASADAVLSIVAEWANTTPEQLAANYQEDGTDNIRNRIDPPESTTPNDAEAVMNEAPKPRTYDEYKKWLPIWLGFTTSADRIRARFEAEQKELWPTFVPRLTLGQEQYLDTLVADRLRNR